MLTSLNGSAARANFYGPAFAVPDTLPATVWQAITASPPTAAPQNAGETPPTPILTRASTEIFNGDIPITKETISPIDLGMLNYLRAFPPRSKAAYRHVRPVLKKLLKPYLAYATAQILAQINEATKDHAVRITAIHIQGTTPVNMVKRKDKRTYLMGTTIGHLLKRELIRLGIDKDAIKTARGTIDSDWRLNVRIHGDMTACHGNAVPVPSVKPRAPNLSRYV
ncbi:hypothetical protein [Bordetella sp. LUAb4]|uniref:hypothetical protein n=1 Tax=Bordetella sp. LUAb4 TaxID=2843195 RepID=UPI001E4A4909|nr:hypothetical protein [Bordetella sp. LUAb4]